MLSIGNSYSGRRSAAPRRRRKSAETFSRSPLSTATISAFASSRVFGLSMTHVSASQKASERRRVARSAGLRPSRSMWQASYASCSLWNFSSASSKVRDFWLQCVSIIASTLGVLGMTMNAVRGVLEEKGIPNPYGGRRWNRTAIRKIIEDDVYLSRTFEEVAERLDGDASYGVW